jgi:hypothetical protein
MNEQIETVIQKEGFLKRLWKGFSSSFKRFPVEALICLTYFVFYAFVDPRNNFLDALEANPNDSAIHLPILFFPVLLVSFCIHRFALKSSRNKTIWYELYVASYLLVWATLLIPRNIITHSWGLPSTWIYVCFVIAFVFLFAGDRIMDNKPFAVYTSNTAVKFVFTYIIGYLVLGMLELIIVSLDLLLLKSNSSRLYLIPMHLVTYIVIPMMCLHFFSEQDSELKLKRFVNTCVNYIFTPALIVYAIILYIYIFKILINWELPQGGVAYMVGTFCTLALLCMLVRPALEKKTFNWFYRFFPAIAIPPIILLWIGITRRLSEYGVTTVRAYLVIFAILLTVFIAMTAFRKTRKAQWMVIMLGVVLAIFTFIPGITAKDFGLRSQMSRLNSLLPDVLTDGQFPTHFNYSALGKDKELSKKYISAQGAYDFLKSEMNETDFQNKYGVYGEFTWRIESEDALYDYIEKGKKKKYRFHNDQELNLGEYGTFIPSSNYILDYKEDIIAVIKGKDTLLKCNVRERWNTIDTVAALSPSAVRFMTTYSNDTYLGRFDELSIDSALVYGYGGRFLLFKKTGK